MFTEVTQIQWVKAAVSRLFRAHCTVRRSNIFAGCDGSVERRTPPSPFGEGQSGMSILELLVCLLIFGLMVSTAITNVNQIQNPLEDSVAGAVSFLKQVRARGLETTYAYTIKPGNSTSLGARYSVRCDSTTSTADPSLSYTTVGGVTFASTTWSVCFDSRGLANGSQTFVLRNGAGEQRTVEVFMGGAVRKQP